MKHYRKRLRLAVQGRSYVDDYFENGYAQTWELDNYILGLVKTNLPNYKRGHPGGYEEEEWNEVKNRLVQLAEDIMAHDDMHGRRFLGKEHQAKEGFSSEEMEQKREEFAELLSKHFRHLRD